MIIIYTEKYSKACQNAIHWFESNNIQIIERKIEESNPISKLELIDLLKLTQNGFEDILRVKSNKVKDLIEELEQYTVDQALELIIDYPELLRKPIITDGKKVVSGFNSEQIRCFIPDKRRFESLSAYYSSCLNC